MYKLLSDIEGLSVEWDGMYGKHWETFSTDEEMEKALNENEAYNNQPEIKAMIEADMEAQNLWLAQCDLEYYGGLDWCAENNIKLEVAGAIKDALKYGNSAVQLVINLVVAHNKRVMMTKVAPVPATNRIADFL